MSRLVWSPRYRLGLTTVDAQHQELFALYNQLYDATAGGGDRPTLLDITERLLRYCVFHFAEEERYMRAYDYPGYTTHRQAHLGFTKMTLQYQRGLEQGGGEPGPPMLGELRHWIDTHTLGMDQEMGAYLAAKGVSKV